MFQQNKSLPLDSLACSTDELTLHRYCQVTPSVRFPGFAQQKRNLSIHEYLSADLLRQVCSLSKPRRGSS